MKRNRRWPVSVLVALAASAVLLWLFTPRRDRTATIPPGNSASTNPPLAMPERADGALRQTEAADRLKSAMESLKQAHAPPTGRTLLADLRAHLANLTPQAASAAIREFLESKANAPTGLGFVVGPDGFLKEPPSLRVFLLDYLAQVDGPAAAAYAEKILAAKDSPDEWAVALRNCALGTSTPEAKTYLRSKVNELLQHAPWQQDPAVSYLEAFDVAAYVGGTDVTKTLTDLVRQKENRAIAHAAYLALDRLTLRDGSAVLAQLAGQPELMEGREATRANYFARAQVSDPAQKAILESYLVNSNIGKAELDTFAGIYPNANFMISHNLLTRTETPNGATLARQDRDALQTVEGWLADPRFTNIKPQLEAIKQRLQNFVAPAK